MNKDILAFPSDPEMKGLSSRNLKYMKSFAQECPDLLPKCYVVVELKATGFKPEHAGQLNFYLAAVDAQIKAPDDNPTIGILLCKTKKRLVAEYALHGIAVLPNFLLLLRCHHHIIITRVFHRRARS